MITKLAHWKVQRKGKDLHHSQRKDLLNAQPACELKGSDQYGQDALYINDEIVRIDVSGCVEGGIEGRVPEHHVECVHLEDQSSNKEIVGQLIPFIHPIFHVDQGKC